MVARLEFSVPYVEVVFLFGCSRLSEVETLCVSLVPGVSPASAVVCAILQPVFFPFRLHASPAAAGFLSGS